MGIRFACPNGHKLHVKEALAGKRGVCPDCGTKVTIPGGQPVAKPATQSAAPPKTAVEPAPRPAVSVEPPAEWYVRPVGGGQLGPASAEVFAEWITEQQVTPDSYVWRSGWGDWRRASAAAADLPAPLKAPPTVATPAVPVAKPVAKAIPKAVASPARPIAAPVAGVAGNDGSAEMAAIETAPTARQYHRRKQNAARWRMLVAGVLLLLTIAMGGVLWLVLNQQVGATDSGDEASVTEAG